MVRGRDLLIRGWGLFIRGRGLWIRGGSMDKGEGSVDKREGSVNKGEESVEWRRGLWGRCVGEVGSVCGYVFPPAGPLAEVRWWYAARWNLRTSLPQLVQPGWRPLANSSRHRAAGLI